MSKWTIEIHYTTGDSYGSEERSEELPVTWENLDRAKEALRWIRADNELYKSLDRSAKTQKEKQEAYKVLPSYEEGQRYPEYSMLLPLDADGETQSIHKFWVGYFERLNSAKIVAVVKQDDDMEYNPGW